MTEVGGTKVLDREGFGLDWKVVTAIEDGSSE